MPARTHRARRRRLGVGVRQPCVEREHRHLDGERDKEGPEQPELHLRAGIGRHAQQVFEGEAVVAELLVVLEVNGQHSQQHQHRAGQGVEEELDRRVQPPAAAPDADDEVHRHQHDLPEDVEQEHVQHHEDAEHARLQEQEESVVLLDALLDRRPRAQDRQPADDHREQDHQVAEPVDAQVVLGAQRRDPVVPLDQLEVAVGAFEGADHRDRDQQPQHGEAVGHVADQVLALLRQAHDRDHADERRQPDDAQNVFAHCVPRPVRSKPLSLKLW